MSGLHLEEEHLPLRAPGHEDGLGLAEVHEHVIAIADSSESEDDGGHREGKPPRDRTPRSVGDVLLEAILWCSRTSGIEHSGNRKPVRVRGDQQSEWRRSLNAHGLVNVWEDAFVALSAGQTPSWMLCFLNDLDPSGRCRLTRDTVRLGMYWLLSSVPIHVDPRNRFNNRLAILLAIDEVLPPLAVQPPAHRIPEHRSYSPRSHRRMDVEDGGVDSETELKFPDQLHRPHLPRPRPRLGPHDPPPDTAHFGVYLERVLEVLFQGSFLADARTHRGVREEWYWSNKRKFRRILPDSRRTIPRTVQCLLLNWGGSTTHTDPTSDLPSALRTLAMLSLGPALVLGLLLLLFVLCLVLLLFSAMDYVSHCHCFRSARQQPVYDVTPSDALDVLRRCVLVCLGAGVLYSGIVPILFYDHSWNRGQTVYISFMEAITPLVLVSAVACGLAVPSSRSRLKVVRRFLSNPFHALLDALNRFNMRQRSDTEKPPVFPAAVHVEDVHRRCCRARMFGVPSHRNAARSLIPVYAAQVSYALLYPDDPPELIVGAEGARDVQRRYTPDFSAFTALEVLAAVCVSCFHALAPCITRWAYGYPVLGDGRDDRMVVLLYIPSCLVLGAVFHLMLFRALKDYSQHTGWLTRLCALGGNNSGVRSAAVNAEDAPGADVLFFDRPRTKEEWRPSFLQRMDVLCADNMEAWLSVRRTVLDEIHSQHSHAAALLAPTLLFLFILALSLSLTAVQLQSPDTHPFFHVTAVLGVLDGVFLACLLLPICTRLSLNNTLIRETHAEVLENARRRLLRDSGDNHAEDETTRHKELQLLSAIFEVQHSTPLRLLGVCVNAAVVLAVLLCCVCCVTAALFI